MEADWVDLPMDDPRWQLKSHQLIEDWRAERIAAIVDILNSSTIGE